MTYVAIMDHPPDLCPGSSKENNERAGGTLSQMETIAREMSVSVTGFHILLPGHLSVIVIEAPDYETANRFIFRLGLNEWNAVNLYQSFTPEETMKMTAERLAAN